jgi:hypothetical protein
VTHSSSNPAAASSSRATGDLATELTRIATTPTMDEVLARIGRRRGGRVGLEAAVGDLDEERDHN